MAKSLFLLLFCDVITHTYPYFNGALTEPPLKVGMDG